jgi:hypothetical protein
MNLYHFDECDVLDDRGHVACGNKFIMEMNSFYPEYGIKLQSDIEGSWGRQFDDFFAPVMQSKKWTVVLTRHKDWDCIENDNAVVVFPDFIPVMLNHSHWLLDFLPRIMFAMRTLGEKTSFLFLRPLTHFQLDSIVSLGFDKSRLFYSTSKTFPIKLKNIYMVGPHWLSQYDHGGDFCAINIEGLNDVRKLLFKEFDGGVPKRTRVYIPRKKRKVKNQDQISEVLNKYSVVDAEVDDLGFDEEKRFFYDVELLIAPEGATLANMIFMRPGTTVISLLSERYSGGLFLPLAKLIGINFITVLSPPDMFAPFWNDIEISPNDLIIALEQAQVSVES